MPSPTLTKTFAFASTAESFVATPATNVTMTYDSATGNPAGALKSVLATKNNTKSSVWTWSGTWENLGIPVGAVVTAIRVDAGSVKCTVYTSGTTGNKFGPWTMADSADVVQSTLWTGRTFSAVDASWFTVAAQTDQTVPSALQTSASSIKLLLNNTLATANTTGASITAYDDQVSYVITYNLDRTSSSTLSKTVTFTANASSRVPVYTGTTTLSKSTSLGTTSGTFASSTGTVHQALSVPTGTVGTQAWTTGLAREFTVGSQNIVVTKLAAFDSGGDGIATGSGSPIRVVIWNRDTDSAATSIIDFSSSNQGTLSNGHRYQTLSSPVTLPAGFNGRLTAYGYGTSDPNGNIGGDVAPTLDGGSGLITFGANVYSGTSTFSNSSYVSAGTTQFLFGSFEYSVAGSSTTYSATVTVSSTKSTFTAAASSVVPTFTGSMTKSVTHPTISSASLFVIPVYHGSLTKSVTHSTITSVSTFVIPVYSGSLTKTVTHPTIVASSGAVATYAGSLTKTINNATFIAVSSRKYNPLSRQSINRGLRDMILIKVTESTAARRRVPFDLVSSSDNVTALTGQTVTLSSIKVYKNTGTETTATGSVTEIGGGLYYYELATGEVDTLGQMTVRVNFTNALPFKAVAQVVAFDPYDNVRYGLTSLPNAAANAANGLITFGTSTGQLNVDGTGGGYIALGQSVPASDVSVKTTQNVGDCLSIARAEGAGKWVFSGTVETIYGPDGVQVVRTFTLNDPVNPTQRT